MSRHFALQPSGTHMTKAHASGRRSHNRLVAGAAALLCTALAGIGIVAALGGCAPSQHAAIYDDDARICDNADSYTFVNYRGGIDPEGGEVELDFAGFTGKYTLWDLYADGEADATLSGEIAVGSEPYRLVMVTPEDDVIEILEGSGAVDEQLELADGRTRLIMLGKGAKGSVSLELEASDNVRIDISSDLVPWA